MPEFFTQVAEAVRRVVHVPRETNRFGAAWDHTHTAKELASRLGNAEGTFDGRHIIGRDSQHINDGVYFIAGYPEVLVVDDTADSGWLKQTELWLTSRLMALAKSGPINDQTVLAEAYTLVRQLIPYEMDVVKQKVAHLRHYTKFNLADFAGGGVCRHQALLCAYLLERMSSTGWLKGTFSIDRSSINFDGHAWVRYTSPEGRVVIIDPTRDEGILHLDTLPAYDANRAFYERPDEVVDPTMLASELPTTSVMEKFRRIREHARAWFTGKRPPTLARALGSVSS